MDFDELGFLGEQIVNISQAIYVENIEAFDLCYALNKFAQELKFLFIINKEDSQEVAASCLFVKVLNGFQSSVLLYKYGLSVEGRIIIRTVLESAFILKAICDKREYAQDFIEIDNKDRERFGKAINDKRNEDIFKAIKGEIPEYLYENLKKENREKGIKMISVEDWAKRADLEEFYQCAYRLLSMDIHTNPRALEIYMNLDENKKLINIVTSPITQGINDNLIIASSILLTSIESLSKLFSFDKFKDIENFEDKIEYLSNKYL
ncbi:MAG TPA: DUF5677 domain-containing protein [Clostridiaceae bacterium]